MASGPAARAPSLEVAALSVCEYGLHAVGRNFSGVCAPCEAGESGLDQGEVAAADPPVWWDGTGFPDGEPAWWSTTGCSACPRGTYSNASGAPYCTTCPAGGFQPQPGQTHCMPCEVGTFAKGGLVASCEACSAAQYQPLGGAARCFSCPNNTKAVLQASTGIEQCECKPGYFTPSATPGTECFACPSEALCRGGLQRPIALKGFSELTGRRYQRVFAQCVPPEACLKGGFCEEGHEGFLCAECKAGWYMPQRTSMCRQCPAGEAAVSPEVILAVLIVLVVTFALSMYFFTSAGNRDLGANVFVLLVFLQTADALSSLTLPWPADAKALFSAMSIFSWNLELAYLDCFPLWRGYLRKLLLQLAMPLLLLGFYVGLLMLYAFALWATRACRTLEPLNALIKLGRSKRLAHALDRTICAYLAVLYLMYPMLVTRSVSLFDCRQITAAQPLPDGTVAPPLRVLDGMPRVVCESDEHVRLYGLGIVALVVYAAGVPLLFLAILYKGAASSSLRLPQFEARFGFLYLRFELDWWWWEGVVTIRRLLLVLVASLLTQYLLMQARLGSRPTSHPTPRPTHLSPRLPRDCRR